MADNLIKPITKEIEHNKLSDNSSSIAYASDIVSKFFKMTVYLCLTLVVGIITNYAIDILHADGSLPYELLQYFRIILTAVFGILSIMIVSRTIIDIICWRRYY